MRGYKCDGCGQFIKLKGDQSPSMSIFFHEIRELCFECGEKTWKSLIDNHLIKAKDEDDDGQGTSNNTSD